MNIDASTRRVQTRSLIAIEAGAAPLAQPNTTTTGVQQ